jgi:hypothetical protein
VLHEEELRARVIKVRENGSLLGGFPSVTELGRYRNMIQHDVEVFRAGAYPNDVVAALEDSLGKCGVRVA